MIEHLPSVAGHAYKRAAEMGLAKRHGHDAPDPPAWLVVLIFVDIAVLASAALFVSYTLCRVYPTLAMIEDPAPPAYEPIQLDDEMNVEPTFTDFAIVDTPDLPKATTEPPQYRAALTSSAAEQGQTQPLTTSSIRRTSSRLYAEAGWRSYFRGGSIFVIENIASGLFIMFFRSLLPFGSLVIGSLLATLATVQLSTAWTHRIIASKNAGSLSSKSWLRSLPPFSKTLRATYVPILVHWAAQALQKAPMEYAMQSATQQGSVDRPGYYSDPPPGTSTGRDIMFPVALWFFAVQVLLVYPAQVTLVRVQASLLAADEDTIVPFDRSFAGKVQPPALGGTGYVNFMEAYQSFSWASWMRLYRLLAKVLLITTAVYGTIGAVALAQFFLVQKIMPK